MDERATVVRAQKGDRDAFAELFRNHHVRVYSLLTYLLGDRTEAEDVTQLAFVRAWDELPRLRDPQAFTAWLNRIARNLASDRARGRAARVPSEDATPSGPGANGQGAPQPPELVLEQERAERVHEAVACLSAPHQEVVVMHHLEGMPVTEVAERLGVPTGTVLSRLARARSVLRQRLASYVEDQVP